MANKNKIIQIIIDIILRLLKGSGSGSSSNAGSSSGSSSSQTTPKSRPRATLDPQSSESGRAPVTKKPKPGSSSSSGSSSAGSSKAPTAPKRPASQPGLDGETPGQFGASKTIEVDPPAAGKLTISYSPNDDGDPDAGEIIWTWIPYEENDGRGKDRPVLVIGKQSGDRYYVVRLTSKAHDGDRDYLSIGSGPWDPQGRPSWIDIEQVYSVHADGMRREAAALDLKRFSVVADALVRRYGWKVAGQ